MSIAGAREHLREAMEHAHLLRANLSYSQTVCDLMDEIADAQRELSGPSASELEDIAAEYTECLCARMGAPSVPVTAAECERARGSLGP